MLKFVVLYYDYAFDFFKVSAPEAFLCSAEDGDHAEEQCKNAYPDCDVVWVYCGASIQDAYDDYWGI